MSNYVIYRKKDMRMKIAAMAAAGLAAVGAFAQGRESFVHQQAYAEMQRVSSQIDVLQSNFDELQRRVARLEGRNESAGLRAEVEALRNAVAELRKQLAAQRGEIVKDLSAKIVKIQKDSAPPPPPPPQKVVIGPHQEYVVQSGDTLSLISQAFNCPVRKIKEMNGLKNDNLRVGQKLMLPK